MRKVECWEVSDEFWEKTEPLIPQPQRDTGKSYKRKTGAGRKPAWLSTIRWRELPGNGNP